MPRWGVYISIEEAGTRSLAAFKGAFQVVDSEVERLGIRLGLVPVAICLGVEARQDYAFALEVVTTRRDALALAPKDGLVERRGGVDVGYREKYTVEMGH